MIDNDSSNMNNQLKTIQSQINMLIKSNETQHTSPNSNPAELIHVQEELAKSERARRTLETELAAIYKNLETLYSAQQEQSKSILVQEQEIEQAIEAHQTIGTGSVTSNTYDNKSQVQDKKSEERSASPVKPQVDPNVISNQVSEIETLKEELKTKNNEIDEKNKSLITFKTQFDSLQLQIKELEAKKIAENDKSKLIEEKLDEKLKTIKLMNERISSLEKVNSDQLNSLEQFEAKLTFKTEELSRLTSQNETLTERLHSLEKQRTLHKESSEEQKKLYESAKSQLLESNSSLSQLLAERERVESSNLSLQQDISNLNKILSTTTRGYSEAQATTTKVEQENLLLKEKIDVYISEAESAAKEQSKLKDQLQTLSTQYSSLESKLLQYESDIQQLQSQLKQEGIKRNMETEYDLFSKKALDDVVHQLKLDEQDATYKFILDQSKVESSNTKQLMKRVGNLENAIVEQARVQHTLEGNYKTTQSRLIELTKQFNEYIQEKGNNSVNKNIEQKPTQNSNSNEQVHNQTKSQSSQINRAPKSSLLYETQKLDKIDFSPINDEDLSPIDQKDFSGILRDEGNYPSVYNYQPHSSATQLKEKDQKEQSGHKLTKTSSHQEIAQDKPSLRKIPERPLSSNSMQPSEDQGSRANHDDSRFNTILQETSNHIRNERNFFNNSQKLDFKTNTNSNPNMNLGKTLSNQPEESKYVSRITQSNNYISPGLNISPVPARSQFEASTSPASLKDRLQEKREGSGQGARPSRNFLNKDDRNTFDRVKEEEARKAVDNSSRHHRNFELPTYDHYLHRANQPAHNTSASKQTSDDMREKKLSLLQEKLSAVDILYNREQGKKSSNSKFDGANLNKSFESIPSSNQNMRRPESQTRDGNEYEMKYLRDFSNQKK